MSNLIVRPQASLIHTLLVIQLVSMGAMEMSGPFWPVYLRTLSASDLLFGFAGAAVYVGPMLGIILTSTFWGRIGDRFGHKHMMIRALLGLALTQLALAYASDVWTILVLRFVQGACAGFIAPAQAYGVAIVPQTRRTRLFAYLQVSTNIGSLAGAVIGGAILDHAAFFWINMSAAILCALCAAATALILPNIASVLHPAAPALPRIAPPATKPARMKLVSPLPTLLGILGSLLMARLITQAPFSLYVKSVFGVDNWVVGFSYGMLALGFIASASLWAKYFENQPPASALRGIAYAALTCAALTAMAGLTRDIVAFTAIYFAWGVLLGATTPVLMSLISKSVPHTLQGQVLGVAQSAAQISSIAGIAVGGWLSQGSGLKYTYFFVASAYVLAGLATLKRSFK